MTWKPKKAGYLPGKNKNLIKRLEELTCMESSQSLISQSSQSLIKNNSLVKDPPVTIVLFFQLTAAFCYRHQERALHKELEVSRHLQLNNENSHNRNEKTSIHDCCLEITGFSESRIQTDFSRNLKYIIMTNNFQ